MNLTSVIPKYIWATAVAINVCLGIANLVMLQWQFMTLNIISGLLCFLGYQLSRSKFD